MRNTKWFRLSFVALTLITFAASTTQAETINPKSGAPYAISQWTDLSQPSVMRAPVASGIRTAGANAIMAPGDLVDLDNALIEAANYLRSMQADITEDNAGNGSGGTEAPDDPEDGGWDWVLTSPPAPFFHTTAASPKNIYGATVLGLYYAYLETNNASYFTAMTDAANVMVADAGIRSASDLVFLMLYNDLPGVVGTAYKDAAKLKFDGRITGATPPTATGFAEYIREVRGASYPNGIIGWDIGKFVVAAAMLEVRYPADAYDYAQASTDMAEVLWQDSYNDNPGYFDIVDDAGWDPSYSNVNYWYYSLGVTGLIEAFTASNSHTSEVPGLVNLLLQSQFSTGAVSFSYGANATDEDWQSTAYAAAALAAVDQSTHQMAINHMAYWTGATQDVSGGWLYSGTDHYPEIGGENAVALYLGQAPTYVIVDDDFASQADVDLYNTSNSTSYVWGYDAFSEIQDGVDAVSGSTVMILPGTYVLASTVNLNVPNLMVQGAGAGLTIVQVSSAVGYAFNISAAGVTLKDIELQKTDVAGAPHNLIYIGASSCSILNNLIYGPDPGTPWSSNGIVSRAMISTGGLTGLLIDNNTIHHLRQPGYFTGPTTGVISNNAVSGTRGWVNEGANLTFTSNSWPLPPNQGAEIALLATLGANGPIWYPDLMALSNANNNAYVDAQFTPSDKGRAISYVDASALPDGFGSILAPVQTISAGISGVLATGVVNVAAGSYTDNLVVGKPMTLLGAGAASTMVYPALSGPNPGGASSLPPGSSNMVLVQAHDVTITGFTFDGDNTSLTSAYNIGGANLDARNGIITNHALGLFNNLVVDHCTIKNIYLRGVYASSGGTFNFHHNTVDNVQAEYASIGMFNFGGSGVFDSNTASNCNDAIASNWSKGCTFTYNVVTASGSGIHTDNAGNAVGSTADLIENNNISNSPAGGYGIFVFAPYIAPTINLNTITDVDVALTCAGSYATVTPQFTNNTADGMGRPNSAGVYVTTDIWGYASGDVSVHFENNSFSNFTEGLYLVAEAGKTATMTLLNNDIVQNGLGISNGVGLTYGSLPNVGVTLSATQNLFVNTTNATDNKAGNFYDQNCWSDYSGSGPYPVGGAGANVDNNPNTNCGLDMSPDNILYLCSGEFEFDVAVGEAVMAMDAAKIHFTYPAEFTVTDVVGADPNYIVFFSQTSLGAGQIDTLKVDLGVLTGVEDGPATLYTVKMSGAASCLSADIEMVFQDLRDSTNASIIVPPSMPIHVVTDCVDPDIVVTAPAPGGYYSGTAPSLDIAASDDCEIEEAYYQLDGCVGAGWVALGTGLSGTAFNLSGWAVPGYAGLPDGLHCLYFKAVDDQGRINGDTCTYSWCFTKDATPPPPPTSLTATPGHNKVHLSWANATSDFDHTVIMRTDWYAGGHEYPEYDDNNPEGPYPPDILTGDQVYSGTGTTHIDTDDLSNATRDVYHFSAFTVDAAGNVSAPSNPARSTSYWLGDVTNSPLSVGNFDGFVYYEDLAIFSNTFGLSHGNLGYENDFDIGPTYNGSPKGIPTTDNIIQFEDLSIFAINFDKVDPLMKIAPIFTSTAINGPMSLGMTIQETATDEVTVHVNLKNNPDAAKSLRFVIPSTASGLKLIDARVSEALSASTLPVFFDGREVDGRVDVSLALLGGETSIGGSGEVAVIRLQRVSSEPMPLAFEEIDVRDGENNRLNAIAESADIGGRSILPTTYALAQNYPNPFNAGTVITYQVPSSGEVSIVVYNVTGQVVKVLYQGQREQGHYSASWDGTDNGGNHVSSGIYLYRITAGAYTASRKMVLVK